MSEQTETSDTSDTFTRPGWRYIVWRGWNLLALGWIAIGIVVGFVTNRALAHRLSETRLTGTVAIAFGLSMVVADLICRWRDPAARGWRRYLSPDAGGAVVLVPSWLIGSWIVAAGVGILLGET